MDGVSVIVCCYNSATRLPKTLRHLAVQKVPESIPWEVIVINNNSTDSTVDLAKKEWAKYSCNVKLIVVDEPKQGLSNARRKGIKTAKFEYLLFCDDDNWLAPNYVQTAYEIMHNNDSIGILGGDSIAECEVALPAWFEENKCDYAVGSQGTESGDATHRWNLWGAGMVLRKSVYQYFIYKNLKSFLSDRKGDDLSAGGDNELCKWYILAGYKLWYDKQLVLYHFIPKERLTETYWKRMWIGFNGTDYWLGRYDILIHIKNERKSRIKNLFLGIKYLIRNDRKKFVIKNIDLTRTYIQFLIGPVLKISTDQEFGFIKTMNPFLYKNIVT